MRKNFTKLVCIGIACFYMFFAFGQENTLNWQVSEDAFVLQQNEVELRTGENKWQEVWADSIIVYSFSGDKLIKEDIIASANSVEFNYYRWENNAWVYYTSSTYTKNEYDFDPYTYINERDARLLVRIPTIDGRIGIYLSSNSHPAAKVEHNNNGQIIYVEGNMFSVSIIYNEQGQINSILQENLITKAQEYYQYHYDQNGNFISFIISGMLLETALYDSQGRIIRKYDFSLGEYDRYYVYCYPDVSSSLVDAENNTPVGNNNQGSFDVNVNIPTDSIGNGSITITLPEGFTLDEKNTALTLDFSSLFTLTVTGQENNSWLFEIKPKTLRNVSLRADEAKKMLQVAYTVDKGIEKGTYDILVNSILFETKGGNYIPEPAITVPAVLTRESVANGQIESAGIMLYLIDRTLYIQSEKADRITVYSIVGQQLYETVIQPGMNTVNAANLPQGILIVKGSSGWVTKVVNKN